MIVDPDFCDHWKTRMLVGSLGDEAAPMYVLRLWAHCQNRRQSTFDNLPVEALKALCRFPGNSNKLESSLAASGFVRRDSDGKLIVCNWEEYNSSLIAAWENGKKGGRPSRFNKTHGIPTGNPEETHGGAQTKPIREDRSREDIPPKVPQGICVGESIEVVIPIKLKTTRFIKALKQWVSVIALESTNGKPPNAISLENTIEKLSAYSERKATGYVLAWVEKRRVYSDWKADWETHQPADIPAKPVEPIRHKPQPPFPKPAEVKQ